jgi:hypothetical protein
MFFFAGREAFRIDASVDAECAQREQELKDTCDNPAEWLPLIDKECIAAEVLIPTKGLQIPRIPTRDVR